MKENFEQINTAAKMINDYLFDRVCEFTNMLSITLYNAIDTPTQKILLSSYGMEEVEAKQIPDNSIFMTDDFKPNYIVQAKNDILFIEMSKDGKSYLSYWCSDIIINAKISFSLEFLTWWYAQYKALTKEQ